MGILPMRSFPIMGKMPMPHFSAKSSARKRRPRCRSTDIEDDVPPHHLSSFERVRLGLAQIQILPANKTNERE
jgi:hypothetical protein